MTTDRIEESPAHRYQAGLAEGELRFQRCEHCQAAVFFPRVVCPHCGGTELSWTRSEGTGTVYSTTTTRSRSGDRNVALIDLDEGFRMMCTVRAEAGRDVAIGDRVAAIIGAGTTPETLAFERLAAQ